MLLSRKNFGKNKWGYLHPWGITYRYLLPAIPLIALALPCGNEKTQKYCVNLYPLYMCGMLTCTAITWLVQMWI